MSPASVKEKMVYSTIPRFSMRLKWKTSSQANPCNAHTPAIHVDVMLFFFYIKQTYCISYEKAQTDFDKQKKIQG